MEPGSEVILYGVIVLLHQIKRRVRDERETDQEEHREGQQDPRDGFVREQIAQDVHYQDAGVAREDQRGGQQAPDSGVG